MDNQIKFRLSTYNYCDYWITPKDAVRVINYGPQSSRTGLELWCPAEALYLRCLLSYKQSGSSCYAAKLSPSIETSGRQSQTIQSSPMSTRSTGNLRSSLAPSQHKSRQLAHLHSQLAQLQAHLSDLDNHLRVTSIQAEAIRRLGGLQAGLL